MARLKRPTTRPAEHRDASPGPGARQAPPRMRMLCMRWFLPVVEGRCLSGREFIDIARRLCPELTPRRFGAFEPLREKIPGDEDRFRALWPGRTDAFAPPWCVHWTATPPCFGGIVSLARPLMGENGVQCLRLGADWDLRGREDSPAEMDAQAEQFTALAQAAGAFFAVAFVQRGVIAGGSPRHDGKSEPWPLPRSSSWVGLPSEPAWLNWFGRPYADLVRAAAPAWSRQERDSGLLVRLAKTPTDRDQLAGLHLRWPGELVAQPPKAPLHGPVTIPHAGRTVPLPAIPGPEQPARLIPSLSVHT